MLGRFLQAAGLTLMVISAIGFLGVTGLADPLKAILVALAEPSPSPVPSETPSSDTERVFATPAPSAAPKERGGGPLEFSLSGSVSFGNRSSSTQQTDPLGATNSATTSSTDESVGMAASLRRRTARTTTEFQLPFGFTNHGSQLGLGSATYSTPRYALGYGAIPITLLGQLTLGATLRGPYATIPYGTGDITSFGGPAFGVQDEVVHVAGVRARRLLGRAIVEAGFARSGFAPLTGTVDTGFLGLAYSENNLLLVGEMADQVRSDSYDGDFHELSTQLRVDDSTLQSSYTLQLRSQPQRFISYGSGELAGDRLVDFSTHRSGYRKTISLDVALEQTGLGADVSSQRRDTFTLGGTVGKEQYSLGIQDQRITAGDGPQWSGLASLQVGVPIRNGFGEFGAQYGRTTAFGQATIGQALYSANLSRQFGIYSFTAGAQAQRQSNTFGAVTKQLSDQLIAQRPFGVKTYLGFQVSQTRTQSALSQALLTSELVTAQRQLSPAFSVQVQYGLQRLNDALNPTVNGRTRIFGLQLNAPFTIGNTNIQGRVDSHLPATIQGRITTDLGNNASLSGLLTGGLGNITVILDNTVVQRTDLQGYFQFSFLKPGQHQVRVETASLPRGLSVDQPLVTLNLEGGQTAQVYLRVGSFAGIVGHVYGLDSSGARIPLPGVQMRIDGGPYSQTDAQGSYGFGRLPPGDHTVEVIENSVPAFASFDEKALKQKISVQSGLTSTLDFVGQQLGSISGKLVFDASLAPQLTGPVQNAYVVAEPGEHAAITGDGGEFTIDNLPPGTYTVSVDNETTPDETGQIGDNLSVTLKGNDRYQGAVFLIGHRVKKVVFSLVSGGAAPAQMHLSDSRLPPDGTTDVELTAPADTHLATVSAFGSDATLSFDKKKNVWVGSILVPEKQPAGEVTITATAKEASGSLTSASAKLTIDPKMAIATLQTVPPNAAIGTFAPVRARFLVDAAEGDKIEWEDGQVTTLGKPLVGRIFTFSLRISLRPLHGILQTKAVRLPIVLL